MPNLRCACCDNFVLAEPRCLAQSTASVAEQNAERGHRVRHQPQQQIALAEHAARLLPQTQQLRSEFIFHLRAVERIVYLQVCDDIFPEQDAVPLLDVVKLDRETVVDVRTPRRSAAAETGFFISRHQRKTGSDASSSRGVTCFSTHRTLKSDR